jgi:hypothetical protein
VIDFRYHLVSLISVFLALAVGIVLGAGPLRGNLGTQLTGQVEQLRSEKDELRVDNTELTRQNEEMSAYVTATAPRLVAGTLSGTRTAVVYDSDTIGTPVDSVQSLLTEAGAEAGPTVRLEPDLWDPAKEDARADALTDLREIAPSLVTQAEEATADASSNSDTLGHLVAVLVVDPQLSADERGSAWDALIGAGLVNVSGRTDVASNAVVVAGATPDDLTVASCRRSRTPMSPRSWPVPRPTTTTRWVCCGPCEGTPDSRTSVRPIGCRRPTARPSRCSLSPSRSRAVRAATGRRPVRASVSPS